MVGGAPVTQEYADAVGADGYAADASPTVKRAKALLAREALEGPRMSAPGRDAEGDRPPVGAPRRSCSDTAAASA